jgi:leucyl-tRNA synthetase
MRKYQPQTVEKKWAEIWSETDLYRPNLDSQNGKYYVLAEFAYPSGDLHMGHIFTWTGADVFARFQRMQGKNVFFPNGFDAFGLPAENAAIKRGVHPQDWTYANIESMKRQYAKMGASFSFENEVITCDPSYYKWNQWLFIKMYEKGLAYRGSALSNWCNSCQTVLANEGVENGTCWRCHNPVVQKEIAQWFWKITDYADRLVWDMNRASESRSDEHSPVDSQKREGLPIKKEVDWPKAVMEGQNNWIGRSEGMEIEFQIKDSDEKITVYTVYPETIFGVTYLVVAPEYPLIEKLTTPDQAEAVNDYIKLAQGKTEEERKIGEKDKTGVFTGSYVINPINGKVR